MSLPSPAIPSTASRTHTNSRLFVSARYQASLAALRVVPQQIRWAVGCPGGSPAPAMGGRADGQMGKWANEWE